jgi:uncharacterized paraquat-inducible protein A
MSRAGDHRYYVCDSCGHIETAPEHDDRDHPRCEHCRAPLDTRAHFYRLDAAETYSQQVCDSR